ncbi:MAG: CpsB/CapC family capsule biosynthesis tyrosine phosphatase [Campylobacterota bacterium]|nr:CpsB/CapC family capsule biosynthesis tyrosine phosphatase [Campylobacterota bacterium]
MFSFWKKEKKSDAPVLKTDLHSHLIPGIDDGSQSTEESLAMLRAMADLGYEKMTTTPHVMADAYRNSTETILSGLASLREAVASEGINIKLDAAAEYYMDEEFVRRLDTDDILTIGEEGYLLFETSYVSKPMNFEEVVFEIGAKGYKPLFAHPERYRYITDPKEMFGRMKELGVFFQLDINSLGGHYGKQAKKHAELLIEWGMIDFLGSDIHRKKQVAYLAEVFKGKSYQELWEKNEIKNALL